MKIFFGKVFFQIFAEINMTRTENRLFVRHFETVNKFFIERVVNKMLIAGVLFYDDSCMLKSEQEKIRPYEYSRPSLFLQCIGLNSVFVDHNYDRF